MAAKKGPNFLFCVSTRTNFVLLVSVVYVLLILGMCRLTGRRADRQKPMSAGDAVQMMWCSLASLVHERPVFRQGLVVCERGFSSSGHTLAVDRAGPWHCNGLQVLTSGQRCHVRRQGGWVDARGAGAGKCLGERPERVAAGRHRADWGLFLAGGAGRRVCFAGLVCCQRLSGVMGANCWLAKGMMRRCAPIACTLCNPTFHYIGATCSPVIR
jgi:hypothetical protein